MNRLDEINKIKNDYRCDLAEVLTLYLEKDNELYDDYIANDDILYNNYIADSETCGSNYEQVKDVNLVAFIDYIEFTSNKLQNDLKKI